MEMWPQDSICSTRQPSKSIDKLVADKPHHRMPQRVTEPPDVQCSDLLATATIILLLVLKNAKKISNGEWVENFLKPWFTDNIYFAKKS